ncbi:DUF2169 domain-containing protein [Acerihabitans sp.]|uniref:DUF2169 family type VI secretion system accessory protein n=1 Tax=Acerihabitans sp. TaxID=2811394 RepID=UPI002ED8289A
MKIIKPLRLGVLHRPWRWQGQNRLGVSVLALADMGPAPRLRPEPELWQLAAAELAGDGGLLDLAIPKACAEFLATGYAYTRHQRQNNACMVKIQVAELEKSLTAFGERFWVGGRPTEALPFARLRLDWENAFGGENDAGNPRGLGAHPLERNGVLCHPLARIEPEAGYGAARRAIKPDCFGPLDFCLPGHFSRIGKNYDQRWLEQDYPGFARDIDWHVFNRAGCDQRWPRSPSLPLGAPWRIWNMHPEQPLQQGVLPDWRARCFITRAGGAGAVAGDRYRRDITSAAGSPTLEELSLRATTLWFFPHLEQMVLIWQGDCAIHEDDALDIDNMLVALETAGESRPLAHYQDVFLARGQKSTAAAHALREQDLVTQSLIGPWLDTCPRPQEGPLAANLARREADLREKHRHPLGPETPDGPENSAEPGSSGHGRDAGLGTRDRASADSLGRCARQPGPLPGELPQFMARLEGQAAAMQRRALEKAAALGADTTDFVDAAGLDAAVHAPRDTGAGPAHYHRMLALLGRREAGSTGAGPSVDTPETRLALHQMYRLSADTRAAAPPQDAQQTTTLRRRLQALLAQTRDLAGMDLTGADLRNLDLRGVNLKQALLESARLDNCLLDGADLSEAMLAHASLVNTSLRDARLNETCLTGARCQSAEFSGARLAGVMVTRAEFTDCCFNQAHLSGLLFHLTRLNRCSFSRATLENSTFLEPDAAGLDFSRCRLEKVVFNNGRLDAACFYAAQLSGCAFITMALDESQFQEAGLDSCVFTGGAHARGASFKRARLKSCNFRQTPLERADFSRVRAENCDFSGAGLTDSRLDGINAGGCLFIRADLSRASLNRADLMGALLQKSRLGGADLRGANLFRADLSLAAIDHHTRLQGAYTHQCKTLPRAQEPTS